MGFGWVGLGRERLEKFRSGLAWHVFAIGWNVVVAGYVYGVSMGKKNRRGVEMSTLGGRREDHVNQTSLTAVLYSTHGDPYVPFSRHDPTPEILGHPDFLLGSWFLLIG
ncbi:hypothetical protein B0I37DRAFT_374672 [Chaetomium sp. MPI-CAGE-AT-0009]|nr:hypothetical protein B0I37DRAFT_374672 [Chaetomium sp. MPI-CAGE-AT-0009]